MTHNWPRGAGGRPRTPCAASTSASRWAWRAEAAARGVPAGRYVGDLLRAALGDLPGDPPPASTPTPPAAPAPVDPGQVSLRALRIIQLREGHDGEPRQLDAADTATVLRILRADLAWVERAGRSREA